MVAPLVGAALVGAASSAYQQNQQNSANAAASAALAAEQRAARKEAPQDALNYFNLIAPDSSQSERLGVSGSAVGQAMSAPTQNAIARGVQKTAQNQQMSQMKMQESQILQQGTLGALEVQAKNKQIDTQNKISERQASAQVVNGLVSNGYAPSQAFQMADRINEKAEGDYSGPDYFSKGSPEFDRKFRTDKHKAAIASGELRVKEDKLSKDWMTSSNLIELGTKSALSPRARRRYIIELQKRNDKRKY